MSRLRRKTISFTIVSKKKKKKLGTNLMKEVKDLYNKNYNHQRKKIKEDTRR
jgi:hypothetical protein